VIRWAYISLIVFTAASVLGGSYPKPIGVTHKHIYDAIQGETGITKRLSAISSETAESVCLSFDYPLAQAEVALVSNLVSGIDPVAYKSAGDYDLEIRITNALERIYNLTGIDYRPSYTNSFKPGDDLRIFKAIYEFEITNDTLTAAQEIQLNRHKQNLDFSFDQYMGNRAIDFTEWWVISTNFGTTNAP